MQAQQIHGYGGPEVFRFADLPTPTPGDGELLIALEAASINTVDAKVRAEGLGLIPAFPAILGCDGAGRVAAVGPGVTGFAVGERVYGCVGGVGGVPGTYATHVVADARLVAPAPARLSVREAAALPLVTITAWEALDRMRVKAGDHVLIHGGAGGVGHVAVQLAKARGARVATTVSPGRKTEIARGCGADDVIDYRQEPVAAYVARLTGGRGFDAVFDATGGADPATAFMGARLNGQVASIVTLFSADLTQLHLRGLSLHVVFMLLPILSGFGREAHGRILREGAALADAGQLKPVLDDHAFALPDLAQAHARFDAGEVAGKLVIDIA